MMKKLFVLALSALMLCASLAGCSAASAGEGEGAKIRIGIIQPMEHTSLTQIRQAILARFEERGVGDQIEILYKDAQGDPGNITTIVNQFVGDRVDYIIPIATGPAQAAAAATRDIPIVFAAVSYPVDAGLVTANDRTDGNITGVSNAIAIEDIFSLAGQLTPNARHFGILFNLGEVNAVSSAQRAMDFCDANGLTYTVSNISSTGELQQAAEALAEKVDAIFVPNDNSIASAMGTLAGVAIGARIPVYVGVDSMVADGGLASVACDYDVLGEQVADMVIRLMEGQTIAQNPVEVVSGKATVINTSTAAAIGIAIPEDILAGCMTVE